MTEPSKPSEYTEYSETDVLIIGSGVAGATTALTLADAGVPVTVVTRAARAHNSNTYWAQGGIVYKGEDDSPQLLAEDIMRAGDGHCNPRAVQILAENGPASFERVLLERVDVPFDYEEDGSLSLALEGGHSVPRIAHAADHTGKAIELALLNAVEEHPNISLLTQHTAADLLTPSHQGLNRLAVYDPRYCVGAYVYDQVGHRVRRILARKTVLATGGLGQIFLRTTNPVGSRGDGIGMAWRAGIRIINAEFVQFHPTCFYYQDAARFLISEAVRGAGARLVDAEGEPFMQRYAPEWKDLAPRDVVARGIHSEMLNNDVSNVYLDLASYVSRDEILSHFPTIYENCLQYGVDITEDLTPVVPAAHYFCGGVWVDEWGLSSHNHLYAVGEVSCTGVHGANRLASTSLLEGIVFGERAATHILQTLAETPMHKGEDIPQWLDTGVYDPDPALISQDLNTVKNIMWNYVGLMRTKYRLSRAGRELRQLNLEIERFYRKTRLTDELIGLRNAARTAIVVTDAAWQNKRSMGAHYRE